MTFTPLGATVPLTMQMENKAIHELFENDYGRMNAVLGVEIPFTNGLNQTTLPFGYIDPPTEFLNDSIAPLGTLGDGTQIWKITHNGVDTHPIHFHLFNVQLINRVGWDGMVKPPEANELGWKETVRMNPLEDCIVAFRPVSAKTPFGVPDSIRPLDPTMPLGSTANFQPWDPAGNPVTTVNALFNFGWEYVWHCHILSHEEMDMMRPVVFNVARALPTAPVLAGVLATGQVNLTWNDPTPVLDALGNPINWGNPANEVGFHIMRAVVSGGVVGAYSLVGDAPANQTAFSDTTIAPLTRYSYELVIYNAAGSVMSNAIQVGPTVPGAPTNAAAVRGNAQATVTVTAPANNGGAPITLYTATSNPGGKTGTSATTTIVVTGLTNGVSYTFTVTATNGVGTGPASAPSNAVTPATVPTAPLAVIATPGNGAATVRFAPPASNGGSPITLYTATSSPGGLTGTSTTAQITVGNLTNNVTYTFTVTATNAVGTGPASTPSNAVTPGALPAAPSNLHTTFISTQYVILAWTNNANNQTGFYIDRSSNGGGTWTRIGTSTGTTFRPTGLTTLTPYQFRVQAYNAYGVSGFSNILSVTTH